MASKPETVKLFDEIAPALDEVDKAQTKIAPKLKELEPKVRSDAKLDEQLWPVDVAGGLGFLPGFHGVNSDQRLSGPAMQ